MKPSKNTQHRNVKSRNMLYLVLLLFGIFIGVSYSLSTSLYDNRSRAAAQLEAKSLKLGTFDAPTPIPTATRVPTPTRIPSVPPVPTAPPDVPTVPPTPPGGYPTVPPSTGSPYCIDDADADMCDDPPESSSSRLVPRGVGGVPGSAACGGSVIDQAHKLVASLPQFEKGTRNSLNPAVSNCGYSTGTYSNNYISTFFVIDAYNLAGIEGLSITNPSHVEGSALATWWKSAEALAKGYSFLNYSPGLIQQYSTGQRNLTGCVMFLNVSSGMHVGIVNNIGHNEFEPGNDYIAILQSNSSMYIDRFVVDNYDIKNTVLHIGNNSINGVAGFGCHN